MNRKSWFGALKKSKMLCHECGELKDFSRYLGDGMVVLKCGHFRPAREPTLAERDERTIEKVIRKLDK